MGRRNEAVGDERHASLTNGYLCGVAPTYNPARRYERGDLRRPETRAQTRPKCLPKGPQPPIAERTHAHPVEQVVPPDRSDQPRHTGISLAIDVDAGVGKLLDQVVKAGDWFASVYSGGTRPH